MDWYPITEAARPFVIMLGIGIGYWIVTSIGRKKDGDGKAD